MYGTHPSVGRLSSHLPSLSTSRLWCYNNVLCALYLLCRIHNKASLIGCWSIYLWRCGLSFHLLMLNHPKCTLLPLLGSIQRLAWCLRWWELLFPIKLCVLNTSDMPSILKTTMISVYFCCSCQHCQKLLSVLTYSSIFLNSFSKVCRGFLAKNWEQGPFWAPWLLPLWLFFI